MTVRFRIAFLVCLAVLAALTIGGGALVALRQSGAQVEAIYHGSLKPILSVFGVRAQVNASQEVLYRALAIGTADAAAVAQKEESAIAHDTDSVWQGYYPAMVSSPEEKQEADRFIAARSRVAPLTSHLETLMQAGKHDDAVRYMLSTVQPAFAAESKAIEAIVDENEHEADASFVTSEAIERKSMMGFAAVIAVVAILLAVVGVFLARSILRPLVRARDLAGKISAGELGHHLVVQGNDEVSDTLRSLAAMDENLATIVRKVRQNATQVAESARQIASGNSDLASRTQEQATSLEETAAAMEEMTTSVRQNAAGAATARSRSQTLRDEAEAARRVALDANDAMGRITQASESVAEMAVLVDEIAFQTNLLALNAAVEAARAGEHGRGFAIVAVEVRRLAQRSATAAKSIKEQIASATERVVHGATLVTSTVHALEGMGRQAVQVSDVLGEIAAASSEQAAGISQVNDSVASIDLTTQQNAALVEEASTASVHALQLADDLLREVSFFRVAEV